MGGGWWVVVSMMRKERAGGGWRHGCGLQALVGCLFCDACVVLGCAAQQRDVSIAHSLLASEGSESSATVNGHGHGHGHGQSEL